MTDRAYDATVISRIQNCLFAWYAQNRRELPWRREPGPYTTFVSEIMLQQTGVERVRPAFERFIAQFPDFETLANAKTIDVLRAWAGLGYNRRAIRLQECARVVCRDFGGALPSSPAELSRLPGVGPYTVAAIQSFVFGENVAALDTNIRRVVSRVWFGAAASDRQVQFAATSLLPAGRSADWNQALMDFGSLQCTVSRPACVICPLRDVCQAVLFNSVATVPHQIAEKSEPYRGSRRFIRGRIVAILRDLPPGSQITFTDLANSLATLGVSVDLESLDSLTRSLASEGFCHLFEQSGVSVLGPPE